MPKHMHRQKQAALTHLHVGEARDKCIHVVRWVRGGALQLRATTRLRKARAGDLRKGTAGQARCKACDMLCHMVWWTLCDE